LHPARSAAPSRVLAAVGLVASLVAGFGVIDLVSALAPGPERVALQMLEAGWGIVFGVLIPLALVVQVGRGAGPVAAVQQLVVVTASLALATLLTANWTVQSALPVCLVLLLALSAAKTDGWRVPAASAAVGSVTLGAVAIMAGEAPAGFDTGWAIAAIVWGVLAGVVATLR
jgi:hypothetical protein